MAQQEFIVQHKSDTDFILTRIVMTVTFIDCQLTVPLGGTYITNYNTDTSFNFDLTSSIYYLYLGKYEITNADCYTTENGHTTIVTDAYTWTTLQSTGDNHALIIEPSNSGASPASYTTEIEVMTDKQVIVDQYTLTLDIIECTSTMTVKD